METGEISASTQRTRKTDGKTFQLQAALHVGLGRKAAGDATTINARPAPRPHRLLVSQPVRISTKQVNRIERLFETANSSALGAVQNRYLCLEVSLDVKNAFNTTPWPLIDAALSGKLVPSRLILMIRSYLKDRSILVGEHLLRRDMTCGVPQGTVLGSVL